MFIHNMATRKKDILDKLAEEVDKISEPEKVVAPKKATKKAAAKPVVVEKQEEGSAMAALLEKNPVQIPQLGDVLEGKVIEITSNSLILDLGGLGTGIVLGKEIKDGLTVGKLKKGDSVSATLIDLENEDGYIELSVREASYERAWDDLESKRDTQDVITTKVLDANK